MLLYIIRHGDPDYAHDCLTEKGKKQAEALARRFADIKFDRIYSSPMGRARQTAEPTCKMMGMEYTVEEWTSESLAWQDFAVPRKNGSGKTWAFDAVDEQSKFYDPAILSGKPWYEADYLKEANSVDGFRRIADASDEFLSRQGYVREDKLYRCEDPSDDRVAVFCHEGFGSLWLSHLLNIPHNILSTSLNITHTGVTILRFPNREKGSLCAPCCLCYSDMSHIFAAKDELPFEYKNSIKL